MAICSRQKRIRTPTNPLFRSGPVSNMSLRETPRCLALESKMTRIWPSLWGWYTLNEGRYQHSSPSASGGANSVCSWSKICCTKAMKCCFISGFLSSVRHKELKRLRACSLLLGRRDLDSKRGVGLSSCFPRWCTSPYPLLDKLPFLNRRGKSEGLLWLRGLVVPRGWSRVQSSYVCITLALFAMNCDFTVFGEMFAWRTSLTYASIL